MEKEKSMMAHFDTILKVAAILSSIILIIYAIDIFKINDAVVLVCRVITTFTLFYWLLKNALKNYWLEK